MRLRWIGFLATIIALVGVVGIQFVVTQLYPSLTTQTLLLALIFITVTAAAIPVVTIFNHRLAVKNWRDLDPHRLWREALFIGLLVTIITYLQLTMTLSWLVSLAVAGVFVLLEIIFLSFVNNNEG